MALTSSPLNASPVCTACPKENMELSWPIILRLDSRSVDLSEARAFLSASRFWILRCSVATCEGGGRRDGVGAVSPLTDHAVG